MIFKKFILLLLLIALVACNIENDCEKKVIYLRDNDEACNKNIDPEIKAKSDSLYNHWDNEYSSLRFFLDKYFDLQDSGFSLDKKISMVRLGEKDFILYSKDEKKSIAWSSICKSIIQISQAQLAEINRLEDEISNSHPKDSLTSVFPTYLLTWNSKETSEIPKRSEKETFLIYSHRTETDSLEKKLTHYLNESIFANCKKN